MLELMLTRYLRTLSKRISSISRIACTGGNMIYNLTSSIYPTDVNARVNTFKITTCFVSWTFSIGCAFRSALRVGISKVTSDAGAASGALVRLAFCIGSTRAGVTGISGGFNGLNDLRDLGALSKWISIISWTTFADCYMVSYGAISI